MGTRELKSSKFERIELLKISLRSEIDLVELDRLIEEARELGAFEGMAEEIAEKALRLISIGAIEEGDEEMVRGYGSQMDLTREPGRLETGAALRTMIAGGGVSEIERAVISWTDWEQALSSDSVDPIVWREAKRGLAPESGSKPAPLIKALHETTTAGRVNPANRAIRRMLVDSVSMSVANSLALKISSDLQELSGHSIDNQEVSLPPNRLILTILEWADHSSAPFAESDSWGEFAAEARRSAERLVIDNNLFALFRHYNTTDRRRDMLFEWSRGRSSYDPYSDDLDWFHQGLLRDVFKSDEYMLEDDPEKRRAMIVDRLIPAQ